MTGRDNPEHTSGEVVVTASCWLGNPAENCVALTVEYPNGTVSTLNLSPETAFTLASRLSTADDSELPQNQYEREIESE